MTFKERFNIIRKSPLARSLAGLLYYLVVYLGLAFLGWGAAGGLQGFFSNPARAAFVGLLVAQEMAAAWISWKMPTTAHPRDETWFDELTHERWRFLNQEMIYALAPFSDRQVIAVLPDSGWIRAAGLVLFAGAGAWSLWAMVTRRRHIAQLNDASKEPLLVMDGPYRRVRYPMFLGILINSLGVALIFRSIGGLFLLIIMLSTILRRIRWVEKDASREVPLQWSAYIRQSWRLIPRVY